MKIENHQDYVAIADRFLINAGASPLAREIAAILVSCPKGTSFTLQEIVERSPSDDQEAIGSAIAELMFVGLL